ncbi:MAG: LGFP repeat-containing protein [Thermomicrobiales bacterium]
MGWEQSFLGYPLTDETATSDSIGRFNHFQGGSIYWTPDTGAWELHGAIRDKWASLGWESSPLGYPTTDEAPTLDGVGRFNHFQRGSIFWSPTTGAWEVHGDILGKWASLGWERSWLGYPTSDEQDFPDGGRANTFQGGAIYWWPDTGPIDLADVIVRYRGLICFGETDSDQGSDSNEPYYVIGIVRPDGTTGAVASRIYEDVDGGEAYPELGIEVYRGRPWGLLLSPTLFEHDFSDPNAMLGLVEAAVSVAAVGLEAAIAATGVGVVVAGAIAPLIGAGIPVVVDAVNEELHTQDDYLGTDPIALSARQMCMLTTAPLQNERGVEFHVATNLMSADGASYKAYFDVVRA